MKKMLKYPLLVLLLVPFLIIGQTTKTDKEKQGKKDDEEKFKISIDVNYFLLDVVAIDDKGHHVTDLEKDDFQLLIDGKEVPIASLDKYNYIDDSYVKRITSMGESAPDSTLIEKVTDYIIDDEGFQKELTPVISNPLSLNPQPPRTFAIVFANLPFLPARWFILRDGLTNYIKNNLGDNVQIAVFSMGMSDLGIIQPFTQNKNMVIEKIRTYLNSRWGDKKEENYNDDVKRRFDLDEETDNFFIMADTPSPDINHSNSSWLFSGMDNFVIQKETVQKLYEQFDIIINKLSLIPGRKNLLLFSEGFPYVSDTLSEYIRMRDRMRLLVSRMNRYNISLYTFDMFTSRNLEASAIRAGLLADLSFATNGAFFKWLGNSSEKIKDRLIQTDIMTSSYYLIGFYINDIELKDDTQAELKINRQNVRLIYNKWLKGKKDTINERNLREIEATKRMFSSIRFTDISAASGIRFLPADNKKTWAVISVKFPSEDMYEPSEEQGEGSKPEEIKKSINADLMIVLEDGTKKEKFYVYKRIESDVEEPPEQIQYNYRIDLSPGLYNLRLTLHSRVNGKTFSSDRDIEVPDFDTNNSSLSIVIAADNYKDRILQNPLDIKNQAKFDVTRYPFYPGNKLLVPELQPVRRTDEKVVFYTFYKKTCSEPPAVMISFNDDEAVKINEIQLFEPILFLDSYYIQQGEIGIKDLKPGRYKLTASIDDQNKAAAEFVIVED